MATARRAPHTVTAAMNQRGLQGTVITVGTFDGLHRGHKAVIDRLLEVANRHDLSPLVVSFQPHPLEVLNVAAAPPLLTPGDERLEILATSGVPRMAILPFTKSLAAYSAEDFVDLVLCPRYGMRKLLIGHDHGFGRGRAGDPETLHRLGAIRGFDVESVPPVIDVSGHPVSSSLIRRAIAAGELEPASNALGRLYSASGRVVGGAKRGRLLGFPTVNLEPPSPRKLLPPLGVYAVAVESGAGRFGGMMNFGPRPTFDDAAHTLEVHLFDTSVDLYGERVRVEFVRRLRDTIRFASPDALVDQLKRDENDARRALTELVSARTVKGSAAPTSL